MLVIELVEIETTYEWSIIKARIKSRIPLNFLPHYRVIRLFSNQEKIHEDVRNILSFSIKPVYTELTECPTKFNIWDYYEKITHIQLETGVGYTPITYKTYSKTYSRKEFFKYITFHD